MKDARRGFTILELVVALTLLSVVASLAVPAYFERSEVTLENACILVARDLRAAQNRAAYMGEPSVFSFDVARNGYEVRDEFGTTLRNPATGEPFLRGFAFDGVFEGVRLESAHFGDDATLVYDRRGVAREEGTVVLTFHGDRRVLRVEAPSGAITIQGSSSGWSDDGL